MLFPKHSVLIEWLYNTSEFIVKSAAQGEWRELQEVRYTNHYYKLEHSLLGLTLINQFYSRRT